jgi:hypothetical protein
VLQEEGLADNVIITKGETMKRTNKILLVLLVLLGFGMLMVTPFLTTPASAQVFYYTPTASIDGSIIYTVRENETCDSIAALNNIDVVALRDLNKLDVDQCRFLTPGQQLILAVVPTPMITAGPSPTPTSSIPTPEPVKGFGVICVYLYNDVNGDAIAETDEITDTGLAGGEISVTNTTGDYNKTGTTLDTGEATCFTDAPEGTYNITIAIPDGYNPTASQTYTLNLKAGDTATVDFSAQASSTLPIVTKERNSSVFLAVIGAIVVLAGLGLGLYAKVVSKR